MFIEHFNQKQNVSSFSRAPGIFNKIDYMPDHKTRINKFKSNEIKPSSLFPQIFNYWGGSEVTCHLSGTSRRPEYTTRRSGFISAQRTLL